MTAQGKITLRNLRMGYTRIVVTDDRLGGPASADALAGKLAPGTPLYPTSRKTKVLAALVVDTDGFGGNRRIRYGVITHLGRLVGSFPNHQTFTLAPDSMMLAPAPTGPEFEPAPAPGQTFEYQVSENQGKTWRTVGVAFTDDDVQKLRDRNAWSEGSLWRVVPENGHPADQPSTPPWSTVHRTAAGRPVYIVHSGPDQGEMRPVTGDGGTVRVEYLTDDGRQVGNYGWEHPDTLTVDQPAGDDPWGDVL